jgi:hypothetical protein
MPAAGGGRFLFVPSLGLALFLGAKLVILERGRGIVRVKHLFLLLAFLPFFL